jgi:hypothetical protein
LRDDVAHAQHSLIFVGVSFFDWKLLQQTLPVNPVLARWACGAAGQPPTKGQIHDLP